MRLRAFTLIELMVTASVVVIIGGLATSGLMATVQLQRAQIRANRLEAQLEQATGIIEDDVRVSGTLPRTYLALGDNGSTPGNLRTERVYFPGTAGNHFAAPTQGNVPDLDAYYSSDSFADTALFVGSSRRTESGYSTEDTDAEVHVYCGQPVGSAPFTGKRLVRFIFVLAGSQPHTSAALPNFQCTVAGVRSYFALAADAVVSLDYLTEDDVQIDSLRFTPVYASNSYPITGLLDVNPAAIRIDLVASDNPAGSAGTATVTRANSASTGTRQYTVRATLRRGTPAYP